MRAGWAPGYLRKKSSHDKSSGQSKCLPGEGDVCVPAAEGVRDLMWWWWWWGGGPRRLHTQILNYMLVHEHAGGSVCVNSWCERLG